MIDKLDKKTLRKKEEIFYQRMREAEAAVAKGKARAEAEALKTTQTSTAKGGGGSGNSGNYATIASYGGAGINVSSSSLNTGYIQPSLPFPEPIFTPLPGGELTRTFTEELPNDLEQALGDLFDGAGLSDETIRLIAEKASELALDVMLRQFKKDKRVLGLARIGKEEPATATRRKPEVKITPDFASDSYIWAMRDPLTGFTLTRMVSRVASANMPHEELEDMMLKHFDRALGEHLLGFAIRTTASTGAVGAAGGLGHAV